MLAPPSILHALHKLSPPNLFTISPFASQTSGCTFDVSLPPSEGRAVPDEAPRAPYPRRRSAGCALRRGRPGSRPVQHLTTTHRLPTPQPSPTVSALHTPARVAPPGRPAEAEGCHVPRNIFLCPTCSSAPDKARASPLLLPSALRPPRPPLPLQMPQLGLHLDDPLLASEGRAIRLTRGKGSSGPTGVRRRPMPCPYQAPCLWPLRGKPPAAPTELLTRPGSVQPNLPSHFSVPKPPPRLQRVLERLRGHPPAD